MWLRRIIQHQLALHSILHRQRTQHETHESAHFCCSVPIVTAICFLSEHTRREITHLRHLKVRQRHLHEIQMRGILLEVVRAVFLLVEVRDKHVLDASLYMFSSASLACNRARSTRRKSAYLQTLRTILLAALEAQDIGLARLGVLAVLLQCKLRGIDLVVCHEYLS